MIMLISLRSALTQTRRAVGRIISNGKGPKRGQYVLLMAKYHICYRHSQFNSINISGRIASYFLLILLTSIHVSTMTLISMN